MTFMDKPSDSTLIFIKVARGLTYLVYAYVVIAVVTLIFGFTLLLLGANPTTPFVEFVYNLSVQFLQPFRGMFPPKQITDTSYFSAAGLFAIICYGIFATAVHSFIDWITYKQTLRQDELIQLEKKNQQIRKTSIK